MTYTHNTTILTILDGWGQRNQTPDNAIANAHTPTWDHLIKHYPNTQIQTSGASVGLPEGQMGNSEVGHMTLGCGRVINQPLTRIDQAIAKGHFFKNPILTDAIDLTLKKQSAVHIIGLLSKGGVHSHENHILAACKLAAKRGVKQLFVHAILDGRDQPPKSAQPSLQRLQEALIDLKVGQIATISGRYYAMDRDQRWQRTESFYHALTGNRVPLQASQAQEALKQAYQRFETDEFVKTTVIGHPKIGRIKDNDAVLFMNFRPDRARQLSHALVDNNDQFDGFNRLFTPKLSAFVCLTEYDKQLNAQCAYPAQIINNDLGSYLSAHTKTQLRLAETEKYAHVTFFFSGGKESLYSGEKRILTPSPNVATYDLQPEMSALKLTDQLIEAINKGTYDFIICNYANADMVGHTGNYSATLKAIECLDYCLKRIQDAVLSTQAHWLITADHGNAEQMIDADTNDPFTSHTTGPVPLVYVSSNLNATSLDSGSLCDIAPTVLKLMQLPCPKEMTGRSLLR